MQKCLAVDWLTLMVTMPRKDFENHKCRFEIRKNDHQTRHFKQIHYIYAPGGDEVGYVAHDPHSEILAPEAGLLKLNNKYLYQEGLKEWVIKLLAELKMTFCSISRIDLALDFQRFNNNLCPGNFIRKYISDAYLKTGRAQFNLQGKEGSSKGKAYESLKFGSAESDIQYYIYNKTKEMAAVKHKQWIEDNWKANGYDGDGDVWRLEFRLKKSKKGIYAIDEKQHPIMDIRTGEIKGYRPVKHSRLVFDMETLDSLDNISELYSYLFNRYFTFVHNNKGKRKDRCKPVTLFSKGFETKGVAIKLSEKREADRAARIFAKHLHKLEYEMKGLDFGLAQWAHEFSGYYIMSRGLESWANKKLKYQVSERQRELYHSRNYSSLLTDAQYMRMLGNVDKSHNPLTILKRMNA